MNVDDNDEVKVSTMMSTGKRMAIEKKERDGEGERTNNFWWSSMCSNLYSRKRMGMYEYVRGQGLVGGVREKTGSVEGFLPSGRC